MQVETTSNVIGPRDTSDGFEFGRVLGAAAKFGAYGVTPVTQPTAAAQAAVVDGSGGTASASTGMATVGASYSQTVVANGFATVIAEVNALRAALVSLGLIKGA